MWPSVASGFRPLSVQLEGELPYLYLDILGYVTTAIGDLADPVALALAMPFKNPDGSSSSAAEIQAAWSAVDAERSDPKGQHQTSGLATHYGQAFAGVTSIRLDQAGIDSVVAAQLATDEATLRAYFPRWDELPADGQMGILSMAWAMGAGFPAKFGTFTAAVNRGDWAAADANSVFHGDGVATRIAANHVMFQNAADVAAQGLDPSVLHYPARLAAPASSSGGFWPVAGALLGMVAGIIVAVARR